MTTDTERALVLRDEAGTYYVLTEEVLAQARADEQQRAAIEAALEDVQGFLTPLPTAPAPASLAARTVGEDRLFLSAALIAVNLLRERYGH